MNLVFLVGRHNLVLRSEEPSSKLAGHEKAALTKKKKPAEEKFLGGL
jgi:hypothetical protein